MRFGVLILLAALLPESFAEVRISSSCGETFSCFADEAARVPVVCENPGDAEFNAPVQMRLFQAAAATAAPAGPGKPWKQLRILPKQKIVDEAVCSFPELRAPALFVLRFRSGEQEIGSIPVRVYPRTVFAELAKSSEEAPVGIIDPRKVILPVLQSAGVHLTELESPADEFEGKLMIAGPFDSPADVPENFNRHLAARTRNAQKPIGIVLITGRKVLEAQLPTEVFRTGGATMVRCNSDLLGNLRNSPEAQLLLSKLAAAALSNKPAKLQTLKLE